MENQQAIEYLRRLRAEIIESNGSAAVDRFFGLRQVDAKVREAQTVLSHVEGLPADFGERMANDFDFNANSRRVRLEALAGYVDNALRLLTLGGVTKPKKKILPPPDFSKITSAMPGLDEVLGRRWREAQKCQYVEAYTSAVILMGSILEGLLLCRATMSAGDAWQSRYAPTEKDGKRPAIHTWKLNTLIDVAVDCGWIKSDRGKFSHALRDSRNNVHPYAELSTRADFDEATCLTSWEVLKASVDDLLRSVSS